MDKIYQTMTIVWNWGYTILRQPHSWTRNRHSGEFQHNKIGLHPARKVKTKWWASSHDEFDEFDDDDDDDGGGGGDYDDDYDGDADERNEKQGVHWQSFGEIRGPHGDRSKHIRMIGTNMIYPLVI